MLDADAEDSNLLIGSSMTICDDSSGDNSAVEELEPSIQNLELDQKFNDAESYLIESGEINNETGGSYEYINLRRQFNDGLVVILVAFDTVHENEPIAIAIMNQAECAEV